MRKIALLFNQHDEHEKRSAKSIAASLRTLLDDREYELWSQEQATAFGDRADELIRQVTEAWVVLVLLGPAGVDAEFQNLAQGAVLQQIGDQGRKFGRLRIDLPGRSNPPGALLPWTSVVAAQPLDSGAVADEIVRRIGLKPQWSAGLAIERAIGFLEDGAAPALRKAFTDVANKLADSQPLTLLVGPYADQESPSRIRAALLSMIDDTEFQQCFIRSDLGANLFPPLWHDHLATLCLLSNRNRDDIAAAIGDAVSQDIGDETGAPAKLFGAIADFVKQFESRRHPDAILPGVTIISVCPGLRLERALISRGRAFERVTVLFGPKGQTIVDRSVFESNPSLSARAMDGKADFMPEPRRLQAYDQTEDEEIEHQGGVGAGTIKAPFVRVIKLGGSRDLFDSIATDFGQSYLVLKELEKLEDYVTAAGKGPYLALGSGLATPPLQAAHAILLRKAFLTREKRPRFALVPSSTGWPDPFWLAEPYDRLTRLTRTQESWFDRIELVKGSPTSFLDALCVAFGGDPTHFP